MAELVLRAGGSVGRRVGSEDPPEAFNSPPVGAKDPRADFIAPKGEDSDRTEWLSAWPDSWRGLGVKAGIMPGITRFCQLSRQSYRHTPSDAVGLGCGENGEDSCRATEVKRATAAGRDMLVVTEARAEVVAEFVVAATEAVS